MAQMQLRYQVRNDETHKRTHKWSDEFETVTIVGHIKRLLVQLKHTDTQTQSVDRDNKKNERSEKYDKTIDH